MVAEGIVINFLDVCGTETLLGHCTFGVRKHFTGSLYRWCREALYWVTVPVV